MSLMPACFIFTIGMLLACSYWNSSSCQEFISLVGSQARFACATFHAGSLPSLPESNVSWWRRVCQWELNYANIAFPSHEMGKVVYNSSWASKKEEEVIPHWSWKPACRMQRPAALLYLQASRAGYGSEHTHITDQNIDIVKGILCKTLQGKILCNLQIHL